MKDEHGVDRCQYGHGLIRMPGECKGCDAWARERELARTL